MIITFLISFFLFPFLWQGHYRYAQAFFELKDIDRALRENKRGQKLCDDGGSQTGDLQRQATMFNDEKKRLVSLNSKKNEVPDLVSESETDSDSDSVSHCPRGGPYFIKVVFNNEY